MPSLVPSKAPSGELSTVPSLEPSKEPSGEPSSIPSSAPSGEASAVPTSSPSHDPSKELTGFPSLELSKEPSGECGLATTCDSGILDDCSGQKTCKTYGTAGYCVQPTYEYYIACTDDCDCLGLHKIYDYFFLGCRNDYKVDMNGERYINTRIVKYYTETCVNNGRCGFGADSDHFRTLDSYRYGIPNENTNGSCPKNCAFLLSEFCPNISQSGFYCRLFCPNS